MRFLSVCSGIEAASVAWTPLGWSAVAFSEIEPFACAVLAHHYPDTPNHGDMTRFQEWPDHAVDLLCGGTPCQSFSVAGLRKGLDDPRGDLMLTFGAIAARYRPEWLVWENVPGVLSSNGGRDFGAFLGLLGLLGYGFAYRVLDAQYFGLAQRRKRVFVVGCLGDWRRAAAVLFERHSLQGHPAPSRQAGQGTARCLTRGSVGGQRYDGDSETFIEVCPTLRAGGNRTGGDRPPGTDVDTADSLVVSHSLRGEGFDASADGTGRGTPLVPVTAYTGDGITADPITANEGKTYTQEGTGNFRLHNCVAFSCKDHGADASDDLAPTLRAMGHSGSHANAGGQMAIQQASAVRRLTPTECERLQGFPDGYTAVPYRGKPAADGPRYKALGNSWAVPVVRWIGERIVQVECICGD